MNRRFLMAIVVGIVAIVVAMNMAPKAPVVETVNKPVIKPAQPVIILRATKLVPAKTEISQDMFKRFDTFDTDSAFLEMKGRGITSEANLVGKESTRPIKASEAFTLENVTEKVQFIPKRLSEAIPPGKRAITIQVDAIQSVGGFIREGDYVDIVGIFNDKNYSEPIRTILSGVQVLSIGTELPTGYSNPQDPNAPNPNAPQISIKATPVPYITFAATPEEAEIITLVAQSLGKVTFRLLLRSKSEFDKDGKPINLPNEKGVITDKEGTREASLIKTLTRKEALDIFSSSKKEQAGGRTGMANMDPRDPGFNPDADNGDPFSPAAQQRRAAQGNLGQTPGAPGTPGRSPATIQPVDKTVEMYKGIQKTVINVK